MGKFRNPFKKQQSQTEAPSQGKAPEVEIAIILVQHENGGPTLGYLNVGGIKTKRQATMNDMYRMCSEVLQQVATIKTADRIIGILQSKPVIQPTEKPADKPGEAPIVTEGYKEEKKEEVKEEVKEEIKTEKKDEANAPK